MEKEVKNMIKLSYTELNTKLKKRVAVITAVMCITNSAKKLAERTGSKL